MVIFEFYIEKQLTEEEHAAGFRNYKLMVAPNPAQSGTLGPIPFEHGRRVAESAICGDTET